MGHSKAEKAETHKRIVKIASKRFREDGLSGVGISELMKEAGLTVGGFYKHFESRDDLVAEALSSAFGGWKRRVEAGGIRRARRVLRKADRRVSERSAPRQSRSGLCLQRPGGGDRPKRQADPCARLRTGPQRPSVDCPFASRQGQACGKVKSDPDVQCTCRSDLVSTRRFG